MADVPVRRMPVPSALWRFVRFVVGHVIWSPITSGRLKDNGWPRGLRWIVVAWAVVYVLMMAAAVFGAPIRSRTPLVHNGVETAPLVVVPLVTVAITFALACLYIAGLHLVWWLRVPATVLVVAVLTNLTLYLPGIGWNDVVVYVAAGLLAVMLAVRWGRPFHWLEFVTALFVIGHAVLAVVIFLPDTLAVTRDHRLSQALVLATSAKYLAAPAGLVAGAAIAELTVSTVAWTVTGAQQALNGLRRWAPAWGAAVIAVLCVLRAVQEAWYLGRGDAGYLVPNVLPSVATFAIVVVACALVTLRADRARRGDPPLRTDPDDVVTHWSRWSLVLAVPLGLAIVGPPLAALLVRALGGGLEASRAVLGVAGDWQPVVLTVGGAAVALCVAVVLSGRGRRVAPVILAATAVWVAVSSVAEARSNLVPTEGATTMVASLAAVGVFCWLLARRRLTAVRGVALATVLVLGGVLRYRDVFDEPLTAAFTLVGVSAAILVGLLWRVLTDAGYSRGDSRRFPRPSRVLVALASTSYAATSIAVGALAGGTWANDFAQLEFIGDRLLGYGLACAAFFAGLSLAARGRVVHPDQPRDDQGRLVPQP